MNYYSFKLSDPSYLDFVDRVLGFGSDIEITKLNWYVDEIKEDDLVFINFSGDKVPWGKGLIAIARVKTPPYDIGYLANNFKIRVDIILKLPSPLHRSEFIRYKDLFDVAGIGPTTKGMPNQAIINIGEDKALILARAIIDYFPQLYNDLESIFDGDLLKIIIGPISVYEEKVEFYDGKVQKDIGSESKNEKSFRIYLNQNKYSKSAISNYTSALKTSLLKVDWISQSLLDHLTNHNLFSTIDLHLINQIVLELRADNLFEELNRKDHGTLSAAINQYIYYIKTLDLERVESGENIIFYGAPGSGKSFYIQRKIKELGVTDEYIFRTTFYPDYSYSDFVGQVYPDSIEGKPTYNFVPGPFLLSLKKAIEEPKKRIYLIIEELNRGNAPAIFGDLFQLLDRVKENGNKYIGESEYPIKNSIISNFLDKTGINAPIISIPSNLFIYASMNSSDQNVFTLDTAFKRRWSFELIQNIFTDTHPFKNYLVPGSDVTWEKFVELVNDKINRTKNSFISSEDKQIGVFFVSNQSLIMPGHEFSVDKAKSFSNKVLEFIWNDVAKYDKSLWFNEKYSTLDKLINDFILLGINNHSLDIFENELFKSKSI